MGRTQTRRFVTIGSRVLATFVVVVVAACSRGDATPRGTLVAVRLSDFKLSIKTTKVKPGYVTFRIRNVGPSTHEFVVDRTDEPADGLPLSANSITVDEGSKKLDAAGELAEIRLGATRDLTLDLEPGRYVLYCNLEGHYRGGMYGKFEVTR